MSELLRGKIILRDYIMLRDYTKKPWRLTLTIFWNWKIPLTHRLSLLRSASTIAPQSLKKHAWIKTLDEIHGHTVILQTTGNYKQNNWEKKLIQQGAAHNNTLTHRKHQHNSCKNLGNCLGCWHLTRNLFINHMHQILQQLS